MSKSHAEIREALGTLPSASHAEHAQRLAAIAEQVAQRYTLHPFGSTTEPEKGNVPVPQVHDSWHYTLPERWQG